MNERLIGIPLYLDSQADADGVAGFYAPQAMVLSDVGVFATVAGSPSAATIDIQVEGTDVQAAIDITTDAIIALTAPGYRVEAGESVEIDLNLTDGTTPTVTGFITIWGYVSE
jgi:hypothetical protein